MGITSYPTDITTVSSDIELVGGKNATEWMIREDTKGWKYILRQMDGDLAAGLAAGTSGRDLVAATNSSVHVFGVNATGNDAETGDYLWLMRLGMTTMLTNGSVVKGDFVSALAGKALQSLNNVEHRYIIGHALETDYGTNPLYYADIFVDPFTTYSL